ncbi:MAG: GxxExxY protein [Ignavibacteriaceae bacterium]|nr:GxxExxY protein [Ignavibacteriaceae bacterium]
MTENEIAKIIVDCAYKVHYKLGPGLLESVYRECLLFEMKKAGLKALKEVPISVVYDEIKMDCGFRADIIAEEKVVVEVKAVEALNSVFLAQTLTYLRLTNCKLGLLINFHVIKIKDGIKRVVNGL